ncbi:MAG: DUF4097 family beta strand repeat-containing protein [Bryobacteraceae bacterium]
MRYLAVIAIALPWTAFAQADFNWTGTLSPGQTLEIKGVSGSIHAELASGSVIEVTAHKTAHHSDPNSVRIEVVPSSEGVTICAVYPSTGTQVNDCVPGKGGHSNTRDNDVNVEFMVKLPAGISFAPKAVNGSVVANGLRSDVNASSVNGKVTVKTTGLATATSVNGAIDVAMGVSTWDGALNFSSVNGSIDVTMPAATGADVQASTVNGELASDFPMTVTGRIGARNMRGRIGAGGHELKLSTVNGAITLHQGS